MADFFFTKNSNSSYCRPNTSLDCCAGLCRPLLRINAMAIKQWFGGPILPIMVHMCQISTWLSSKYKNMDCGEPPGSWFSSRQNWANGSVCVVPQIAHRKCFLWSLIPGPSCWRRCPLNYIHQSQLYPRWDRSGSTHCQRNTSQEQHRETQGSWGSIMEDWHNQLSSAGKEREKGKTRTNGETHVYNWRSLQCLSIVYCWWLIIVG